MFSVWGMFAVNWGHAMTLFKILGAIASPVLALASVQILIVNTTLLPNELRPAVWRRFALILSAIFYGTLTVLLLWNLLS
ncbi:MAG: hypothetical protein R3C11_01200 [Planctomycetaceae bacterium]